MNHQMRGLMGVGHLHCRSNIKEFGQVTSGEKEGQPATFVLAIEGFQAHRAAIHGTAFGGAGSRNGFHIASPRHSSVGQPEANGIIPGAAGISGCRGWPASPAVKCALLRTRRPASSQAGIIDRSSRRSALGRIDFLRERMQARSRSEDERTR